MGSSMAHGAWGVGPRISVLCCISCALNLSLCIAHGRCWAFLQQDEEEVVKDPTKFAGGSRRVHCVSPAASFPPPHGCASPCRWHLHLHRLGVSQPRLPPSARWSAALQPLAVRACLPACSRAGGG